MELMESTSSMGEDASITAVKELDVHGLHGWCICLMIFNPDGGPYSPSCSISPPLLCINGSCAKFCSVPFRSQMRGLKKKGVEWIRHDSTRRRKGTTPYRAMPLFFYVFDLLSKNLGTNIAFQRGALLSP